MAKKKKNIRLKISVIQWPCKVIQLHSQERNSESSSPADMKYYWTHFNSCSSHTNNRQTRRSSKQEHPKWGGKPRQRLEKCIIPHSAASSFGVTLFHPQLRGPPTGCIDCSSHACSSSLCGLQAHVIDGTVSSFVTFTFITAALADYFYGSVKADTSRYGGHRGRKYVPYSVCSIII